MSNNSIVLGHFLPSSLLQQSTSIRRLTSTSSDSGDSGVDPVKDFLNHYSILLLKLIKSHIDKNEKSLLVVFHHQLDQKNWLIFFNPMDKLIDLFYLLLSIKLI